METLSIKNFAGLKDVTIEVRPVTGFIGPQASGKSILAKLVYYFREIAVRLPAAIVDGLGKEYQAECCKRFARYFPVDNTVGSDFQITYSTNRENVSITFNKAEPSGDGTFSLEWSQFYSSALVKFAAR